jgi:3-phosphoinositide dependent protein kinase-1
MNLAKHFAAELIIALQYLRKSEIIHRDLKPGNILLDKDFHLKLIDFATAKVLNHKIAAKIPKPLNKRF